MRFIMMFSLFSILFPSELKLISAQNTFQRIKDSDIYFHLNYIPHPESDHLSSTLQWWPSDNLYLSGTLASLKIDKDKSLYHNMSAGYTNPNWKTKHLQSFAIDMGVHRLRFYKNSIYRWFHVGLISRFTSKWAIMGFDFNRYFHNLWASSRYTISVEKFIKGINYKGGVIQDDAHSFTPFIGITVGI
jgi:hypothetical protein